MSGPRPIVPSIRTGDYPHPLPRSPEKITISAEPLTRDRRQYVVLCYGRDATLNSGGARVGTGARLLTGMTQVRFLPPELSIFMDGRQQGKGQPIGDGTRFEPGRARALRVRLPPLPPSICVLGRAARHCPPTADRRVRLPQGALGNRLTGRLSGFEPDGGGSNPPSRTRGRRRVAPMKMERISDNGANISAN
jgi:hypothetical protein